MCFLLTFELYFFTWKPGNLLASSSGEKPEGGMKDYCWLLISDCETMTWNMPSYGKIILLYPNIRVKYWDT